MEKEKIVTPGATVAILRRYGLHPRKTFGQNFLTDENILNKIVAAVGLTRDDLVLEVGPGIGTVTQALAGQAGLVVAVEIDRNMIAVLRDTLSGYDNVTVVEGDILAVDLPGLLAEADSEGKYRRKLVGNLPYYITTPILFRVLEDNCGFKTLVVMVQKEVAERIVARPGGKIYGALSIAVQYRTEAEIIAEIPRTVFHPPPQVSSAVLRLTRREEPPVSVTDEKLFFSVVKAAFQHRRKTMLNALSHSPATVSDKAALQRLLEQAGIDPLQRGENLDMADFAVLSNLLAAETDRRDVR
ncbi:MAG: 16S rRNA (adenine(1518)-N(6)/adenine(1519)-N(6))-dimethyltransferase RsmA [bacterium]|jgi:16S rRNA (adenine1518-N6/adenine1519-N6)-dimethyltransferase